MPCRRHSRAQSGWECDCAGNISGVDVRADTAARVNYDDAPLRPFHLRVAVAACGGVFSDGFGLGIIGISLTRAPAQLGLNPVWLGLLGGASLFGLFAGALLTGPAADRFGRRPIFAYNMAILAALSLLQGIADSAAQLLALRVGVGFLLGTDYVVSKALLTEFTPRRARGRSLGLLSVAWSGGYACAYFVGVALSGSGPRAWSWMLLTSAIPALLVLPLRLTLPESPLWLANHGLLRRRPRRGTRHAGRRRSTSPRGRPPHPLFTVAGGGCCRPNGGCALWSPAHFSPAKRFPILRSAPSCPRSCRR